MVRQMSCERMVKRLSARRAITLKLCLLQSFDPARDENLRRLDHGFPFFFNRQRRADGMDAEYAGEFVRRGVHLLLRNAEDEYTALFAHDL